MKFEEVLPALRAGKKVRRACFHPSTSHWVLGSHSVRNQNGTDVTLQRSTMDANDWEIIAEPKRVADYLIPTVFQNCEESQLWIQKTVEVGKQRHDAVLVPGSEREVTE